MPVDLPEDLLLLILVRLPAKSLIRYRSVCKSWFLLISSPKFVSLHCCHNHVVGNYQLLLRWFCGTREKEIYSLHDENDNLKAIGELGFPFDNPQVDFFTLVGCVNGLICLWDDTNELNPVTLWNPAIQKSFQVPHPVYSMSDDRSFPCRKVAFGFGFDAISNDYKILKITFFFSHFIMSRRVDRRPLPFLCKPVVCSADIFSLSTKSWRSIGCFVPLQQLSIPVFVNGSLHFLTRKDDTHCTIVSFGLNAETFTEIACPQDAKFDTNLDQRIVAYSETISLLNQWYGHRYDIWVMKEYNVEESWTRLLSIDLEMTCGWKRILGFSRNGGLILAGNGSWVGYPTVEAIKLLDFQPPGSYYAPHAELYMESLVLMDDGDSVIHLQQNNGNYLQENNERRRQKIHRVPGKRRGKRARMSLINRF